MLRGPSELATTRKQAFTTRFLGLGQRFRRSVPSGGFSRGVRRHTVSTAETTDCAHTYHHAFGLQQKGRSTGVVWCPEGRKCAPAIQSLRSLARHPFCLNIYQKSVAEGKRLWPEA